MDTCIQVLDWCFLLLVIMCSFPGFFLGKKPRAEDFDFGACRVFVMVHSKTSIQFKDMLVFYQKRVIWFSLQQVRGNASRFLSEACHLIFDTASRGIQFLLSIIINLIFQKNACRLLQREAYHAPVLCTSALAT